MSQDPGSTLRNAGDRIKFRVRKLLETASPAVIEVRDEMVSKLEVRAVANGLLGLADRAAKAGVFSAKATRRAEKDRLCEMLANGPPKADSEIKLRVRTLLETASPAVIDVRDEMVSKLEVRAVANGLLAVADRAAKAGVFSAKAIG